MSGENRGNFCGYRLGNGAKNKSQLDFYQICNVFVFEITSSESKNSPVPLPQGLSKF